jgi:hypothetical protein
MVRSDEASVSVRHECDDRSVLAQNEAPVFGLVVVGGAYSSRLLETSPKRLAVA